MAMSDLIGLDIQTVYQTQMALDVTDQECSPTMLEIELGMRV